MAAIPKKLPKRCSRSKGSWLALHNSRAHKVRELPSRNARQGINFPAIGEVGSAAYRRAKNRTRN